MSKTGLVIDRKRMLPSNAGDLLSPDVYNAEPKAQVNLVLKVPSITSAFQQFNSSWGPRIANQIKSKLELPSISRRRYS